MSDETTTAIEEPVVETEAPDEPAAEATPEPVPEGPSAEQLTKQAEELARKEKALQKGFQEIAEREKRLEKPSHEGVPDLEPDSQKLLDKYLDTKYGGKLNLAESLYVEIANTQLDDYAEKEGIDPDTLRDTIREYGIAPADQSIKSMRSVFERAAKVVKSADFDRDAEVKRIEDEVRERLVKEYAEKGVSIDGIAPSRTEPDNSATLDDDDLDSATRNKLLQEKHSSWFKSIL